MADIIESNEVEESGDVSELPTEMVVEETPVQQEPEVPEPYRGKSPAELAKMVEDAQKMIGRQANELGENRRVMDEYIKAQLTAAPKQPVEDIDFFTDPEAAVAKMVESHPKVRQAEAAAEQMVKMNAMSALQSRHPDLKSIVTNQGFQDWVGGSPMRMRLFQQADKAYDVEAADELLSLYKERQQLVEQTSEVEKRSRDQQVQKASTGNTRGSGAAPSRKVYRRSDLIKLNMTDPERYEAMSSEIMAAYAEGRVK
jgi:hypothetical protein